MYVIKRSGEREEFNPEKTKRAIVRSGLSMEEAEEVLAKLMPQFYDGITTEEIYRRVNLTLDSDRRARYGLKKAILNLGPEGHSFESFVAKLFQAHLYHTQVRKVLRGRCVQHEIDVLLEKDGKMEVVECKFHNTLGVKCDIKTALYVHSRFLDLEQSVGAKKIWLVTNTRFSSDAARYGQCMKMGLLGWNYPEEESLEGMIEQHRTYPVTILDMRRNQMRALLDADLVLVQDVLDHKDQVRRLIGKESADELASQASLLIR